MVVSVNKVVCVVNKSEPLQGENVFEDVMCQSAFAGVYNQVAYLPCFSGQRVQTFDSSFRIIKNE